MAIKMGKYKRMRTIWANSLSVSDSACERKFLWFSRCVCGALLKRGSTALAVGVCHDVYLFGHTGTNASIDWIFKHLDVFVLDI